MMVLQLINSAAIIMLGIAVILQFYINAITRKRLVEAIAKANAISAFLHEMMDRLAALDPTRFGSTKRDEDGKRLH